MTALFKLLSFILIAGGIFVIADIDVLNFVNQLEKPFEPSKKTMKKRILLESGKKKENGFTILINDTKNILQITGKEDIFPKVCVFSVAASFIGIILGLSASNYFIAPVLGIGFCMIPFVYIKIMGTKLNKQISDELETALSIITSSYIRSESIITAIEENTSYINSPVKEVFQKFLRESTLISTDMKRNLTNMQSAIDNDVFREWCDAVIACQSDANLKYTLPPIVKKLSNIRIVRVRLDALLYAPVKEFISLVVLLVVNIPLFYFINRTWFDILIHYTAGKIVLTVCAAALLVSFIGVIKVTRPIEYKR